MLFDISTGKGCLSIYRTKTDYFRLPGTKVKVS